MTRALPYLLSLPCLVALVWVLGLSPQVAANLSGEILECAVPFGTPGGQCMPNGTIRAPDGSVTMALPPRKG